MTSVVLSVFLLLQAATGPAGPAALRMVAGRLSVEGGAQVPSSFTLPLMAVGGQTALPTAAANSSLTIRPQIDGGFRVQMRTGEYRVGAPSRLPPGYTLKSITYGGVDLLRNPLTVTADGSAELIITLVLDGPSPAVSVSGHVTGTPPGQFHRIALRESSGGELSAALEATVGADGSFTFPKVLPGNYIVYLRLRTVTQVAVVDKDVTGLIVAYPKEILVAGHVILEGPQIPIPPINVEANGQAGTSQNSRTGTFVLSLRNGENSISVRNIPEPYMLKSVTYGDVDLQKEPLKLDGPANWDIVVRLAPKN